MVKEVSADLSRARRANDLRDRLTASGVEVLDSDADEFNKFFRSEIGKWAKVVKDGQIKVE